MARSTAATRGWSGRRVAIALPALSVSPAVLVLLLMVVVSAATFAGVAWARWRNLEVTAYDAAVFDQVIWNTAHGRWFENSFLSFNYVGEHFQPVLLLFAPAYWFGANGLFLSVVQGLTVALAALPLYGLALRLGLREKLALAFVACFLSSAYLHRAINFDFHPETMIALPLFTAAWAAVSRRPWLAFAAALSTLAFKEDAVFVALSLAAILAWQGYRRHAAGLAALAIAWAAIVLLVVMPLARDGMPSGQVDRYAWLVPGAPETNGELLMGVLLHPWLVLQHLLEPARLRDMALFAVITAPLAFWRPGWLLMVLPGLAIAVLSAHDSQRQLDLHYTAELVPLALVAAIIGAVGAQEHLSPRLLVGVMAFPAAAGFLWLSPFSPVGGYDAPATSQHRAAAGEAFDLVPGGASVSAQTSLLPHLARRELAYEFPYNALGADWVLVDEYGKRSTQSLPGFWEALEQVRARYERVYSADGIEVYRRPAEPAPP